MSNQLISWLLIAEITLPLLILSLVLGWVLYSNGKKNKEAARNLILKIKNNEENERAALMAFLTGKLSMEEDASKEITKKIINERKFLFRNLISGLLDKNLDALSSLESDMSRITNRYHDLNIALSAADSEGADQAGSDEDAEKIAELKEEVKSLKHEIHITLTTLNNIFGEFSSMFGEEVPENEMSVDQIINAMEAFSGKSSDEDSENATAASADGVEESAEASQETESEDQSKEESEEESEVNSVEAPEETEEQEDEPDAFAEVESALDEIAAEESPDEAAQDDATEVKEEKEPVDSDAALEALDAVDDQGDVFDASEPLQSDADESSVETDQEADEESGTEQEPLDFSIDDELDDIDSALDELELGSSGDDEPSWDDAFEESGDKSS